jgi:N-succinyldiaminopimelate aminotransferase
MHPKRIASRVSGAATTVFSEMTELARQYGAINLGQGFPELREELARHGASRLHRDPDPEREVVVTSGATEAIMAGVQALVDPGEEVIVFEPFYDSYVQAVHFAGATPIWVQLYPPDGAVQLLQAPRDARGGTAQPACVGG